MSKKEYLGDGAYVEWDGFAIVLTTEDGISTTNKVVLEPPVLRHFEEYVERLRASLGAEDLDKPVECSACEGTGLFAEKTFLSPEIKCDDCNGRGTL